MSTLNHRVSSMISQNGRCIHNNSNVYFPLYFACFEIRQKTNKVSEGLLSLDPLALDQLTLQAVWQPEWENLTIAPLFLNHFSRRLGCSDLCPVTSHGVSFTFSSLIQNGFLIFRLFNKLKEVVFAETPHDGWSLIAYNGYSTGYHVSLEGNPIKVGVHALSSHIKRF